MAKRVTGPSTAQPIGLRAGPHARRPVGQVRASHRWRGARSAKGTPGEPPARGWRLTAAAAGVGHAGLVAAGGAWPALLLAAATVAVAGAWSWLLAGHRQDLMAGLGVVWLGTAMVATDVPLAFLTAAGAGVAALATACGSLR